jgi:hypothetical protein
VAELPEARLNLLLRRVDWRFLLPATRFRRAVCFADAILHEALALVADRVYPGASAPLAECDLAVLSDPDPATLREACAALQPGGTCYVEFSRPGRGGARRLDARLRRAGLEPVGSYLAWRSPRRASVWVPLASPEAVGYFHRRVPTRTRTRRPAAWLARAAYLRAARAGLVGTLSVVARKPGPGGAEPALLDPAGKDGLSLMLLTGGPRSVSKIAGLVFAAGEPRPPLLVKVARSEPAARGIVREAEVLECIERWCRGGLEGVPRVVFRIEQEALVALGETALPGVPLLDTLTRRNYRAVAGQGTDWLIRLALCSRRADPEAATRLVREELATFERNFGRVLDPGELARTHRILTSLGTVPAGCEHRDFSPWNVFVGPKGRLAVFDWESSEPAGLPALDLPYFLVYLGAALHGSITPAGVLDAARESLDPATSAGAVYRKCQVRYAEATGVDPDRFPALRLLMWILHSRSEHRRLAADAAGEPAEAALRGSLFVRLWRTELARFG